MIIVLGFVIAYANNMIIPSWAWVLCGIQVFFEIVKAILKMLKELKD